jgi:hypothetical protein
MASLGPQTMLGILLVDHRVAFFALITLYVATAIPLGYAWARVLPEERPPFEINTPANPRVEPKPSPERDSQSRRKLFAIGLLICVTIGYLLQFPGFPRDAAHGWAVHWAGALAGWVIFGAEMCLIAATGFAACYAFLNPGPLRIPLTTAAALVLMLWLISPLLQIALLAN